MKLLRSFPALAFGLVLLSLAALCTAQRSVGLLLMSGTLAAISWYITEGPRGKTLPRWVSNILVIAASLWVFIDLIQNRDDVLGVLGRFAVWLTLIKLYERRKARDYAHLLTLSLLLMLTACLRTNDLVVGVMLVLYAGLGLYVLLQYQLFAAFERESEARSAAIPADYRFVPPLKPITGLQPVWRFRMQALGVGVAGFLVSALVFVSYPRDVGAGMLGTIRSPITPRQTGFNPNVDLNQGGRITESRVKVMSVQLTDSRGSPMRLDDPVRLRGAALNVYIGAGRWSSRPRSDSAHDQAFTATRSLRRLSDEVPVVGPVISQRVILNRPADGSHPLFSMYAPDAVAVEGSNVPLQYAAATQMLHTERGARRVLSYTVRAQVDPGPASMDGLVSPVRAISRGGALQQDVRDALRDIANARLAAAGVPVNRPDTEADIWEWNRRVAQVFTNWMHSGEFTYTTDLSGVVYPSAEIDPIVRFLTVTKRGHCEFYASALAALCLSKGVPARMVVGYVAYEYDEAMREYVVLESNAHAWAEVGVGPFRWQTFDPTPPSTLASIHSISATMVDQVRWVYERFEGNWASSIANFDSGSQSHLATSFNQSWSMRFATTLDQVRDWMERVNMFFNVGPGGYIWMGIVALALVIAIIALVKLMRRSLMIRRTLQLQHLRGREYQRMLRQLGFYLDMLRVLRRAGLAKPDWQPPLAFAKSLASRNRRAADLVRQITDVFYEARYGNQRLESREVHAAADLVQELAQSLSSK